jgi:HEPN domain-containing protein
MTEPARHPSVYQWVERAEHDLLNAQHTLATLDPCPFDTDCFHAQQCAEKYLKALVVFRGRVAPRTHDLARVVARLPRADQAAFAEVSLRLLNPYVIEGRYPGDWDPMDRSEAEAAVEIAQTVRRAVFARMIGGT